MPILAQGPLAATGRSAAGTAATPQGPIVVEEDWWILFVDEPGCRFHRARDLFLKKDAKAAAHHLEHGIAWSGHEAERGTLDVIKGARLVGGKLVEGTGWTVAEVGKAIDDLGAEADKLGKRIESAGR